MLENLGEIKLSTCVFLYADYMLIEYMLKWSLMWKEGCVREFSGEETAVMENVIKTNQLSVLHSVKKKEKQ